MSLEAFIAEAKARAKAKPGRKVASRPTPGESYQRTREELLQMKLDACVPVSVHLRITYQQCECGERYESVNTWPLIKRVSPTLTHYEAVRSQDPNALAPYHALPRFVEFKEVQVPWCDTCFANATHVEVTNDKLSTPE
jgi:hypothetical protein